MGISVDRTRWPLVAIRFVGTVDDATFKRYLSEYDVLLEQNKRYGILLDALDADAPTAKQRSLQATWMKEREARLRERCVGGAFAIGSPIIRGALTAILWLQPLPFPHAVFGTTSEAERWVRTRLRDADVEP